MRLFPAVYAADTIDETRHVTLLGFLDGIKDYLLGFMGAFFVLFIIIGGYQLIASGGSPEKIKRGKKTLLFSIIGLLAILLSQVIFYLLTEDLMDSIFGTSSYTTP